MTNVIVAFSKQEDARSIKNILMKNGFQVIAVCTSGSQVLSSADDLHGGIVVCGFRFADMMFDELRYNLPPAFDMLMISSPSRWSGRMSENIVCLPMPLKVHELVRNLEQMTENHERRRKTRRQQPKVRNEVERDLIARAKALLMERNNMTEDEAHRYIQKCSMNNGTNMSETAQMVMSLIEV